MPLAPPLTGRDRRATRAILPAVARFESIAPDKSHGDGIAVEVGGGAVAIFSHGRRPMSLFTPEDGRIVEVNDAWLEKYGYSREEACRMRVQDVSAEPQATTEAVRGAEQTGGAMIDVRWHRDRAGKVFPVEITSGTLRLESRVLMYAVMNDISERLEADQRRVRSEARFRALVEHMPIVVIVHAQGRRILYMNPATRKQLGYEEDDDMSELMLQDLIPEDDWSRVAGRIATIGQGLPTPPAEGWMVRRDGTLMPLEVNAIPFEYDGQPAVLAMGLDLRERKRMEAQLVLADRLAALGRLAASVGHEINNPLAYLLGNVQLLERDLACSRGIDPDLRQTLCERLDILREGALRVRDIVRDLKSLSGGEAGAGAGRGPAARARDVYPHGRARDPGPGEARQGLRPARRPVGERAAPGPGFLEPARQRRPGHRRRRPGRQRDRHQDPARRAGPRGRGGQGHGRGHPGGSSTSASSSRSSRPRRPEERGSGCPSPTAS